VTVYCFWREARGEVGEIEKVLGHRMNEGRSVTAFVVAFP
jgi:hypothetical protein